MTNDELLAGYLDRSLSEDQLIELEARRNAEPAFAQEVNEMLTVEKLLATSAPVITPPVQFLSTVESTVAAKVAAGSAAGGFLTLSSSTWLWILGAGLVVTAAYFTIQGTSLKEQVERTSLKEQVERTGVERTPLKEQVERTPLKDAPRENPTRENSTRENSTRIGSAPQVIQSDARSATSNSVDMGTQNSEAALQSLLKDLQACRASGDHVRCSQIALNVGRTYRLRGSTGDAEEHLELALSEAKTARLVQFEVEANGELGLVAKQQGKMTEAKSRLNQAVELGTKNGISVDKWTKALQELEN